MTWEEVRRENWNNVTHTETTKPSFLRLGFRLFGIGKHDITERNDDVLKEDYQQRFDADFILIVEELSQLFELLAAEFWRD